MSAPSRQNAISGVNVSWSFKYNLLWQKILKLDGPFPLDKISRQETDFYISQSNAFGPPMDPRHPYVKTDWLSWVAALSPTDEGFHALFEPIFKCADGLLDLAARVAPSPLLDPAVATLLGALALCSLSATLRSLLCPSLDILTDPHRYCNETVSRYPFTDLYDTVHGTQWWGAFVARPVIGGLFAKMLV